MSNENTIIAFELHPKGLHPEVQAFDMKDGSPIARNSGVLVTIPVDTLRLLLGAWDRNHPKAKGAIKDGWLQGPWPKAPTSDEMIDVTDHMARVGAHVLSEWLDDAAPLHERRYVDPARMAFAAMRKEVVARPVEEWHDDDGPVTWWKLPVSEPAWIGSPLDEDWPGYHTHWTPHPVCPKE